MNMLIQKNTWNWHIKANQSKREKVPSESHNYQTHRSLEKGLGALFHQRPCSFLRLWQFQVSVE